MTELFILCLEFFKTGLFAIGGGLATIPFLTQISQKYPHWFSLETLADMIAISESTPGPLGINMATYVGFTVLGVPGAFAATISLVLPSFIVILLIYRALKKFRSNRYINAVFKGLRPAATGLIAGAGFVVFRMAVVVGDSVEIALLLIFIVILICTQVFKNVHPIAYIAASALVGYAFSL